MTASDATLPFFDTHAHLNLLPPEIPADQAFQSARARGLEGLVNIGTRIASSRESVDFAARLPGVWATVGIHPSEAATLTPEAREELARLASSPRVVGIGETGIDRADFQETPLEVQAESLRAHIALARERDLPLILHCREAFDPLFSLLDSERLPDRRGVFHCFTGSLSEAFGALDRGFYLSFSGIVTFKNAASLRELLPEIPADRILLETDCPYLAPVPYRGKPNQPAFLPETLKVCADARGEEPMAFARQILDNTRTFFAIDF